MASIRKEILIAAHPHKVWEAVRDFGAVHKRLVPGVLTDSFLDNDARIVVFANGARVRELLVDLDDVTRRLAWAAVGGQLSHHNASMQVFDAENGQTRLVWITDILPSHLTEHVRQLVEQGAAALKKNLEVDGAAQ